MHDGDREMHSCRVSAGNLACESVVRDQAVKGLADQQSRPGNSKEGTDMHLV